MNCIDNECRYLYCYGGEPYCAITYKEVPEDIDITQCAHFSQARTCIKCKNLLKKKWLEGDKVMAIPVQILLQAGKCGYVPKRYAPPIPKNTRPLDALDLSHCYVGQVVYDDKTNKCYMYTGETFTPWKEIR